MSGDGTCGRRIRLVSAGVAIALLGSACTSDGGPPVSAADRSPRMIPQPVVKGLDVAPEHERVDLFMPTFTNPTEVTNPLFPVSRQRSVLMLGHVDGKPFRTEVTLLPETRVVEWAGQRIEALVSQYNAFLGGRIEEVAYDYYAQADDGSVWYLGEDVFDFRDGAIVVTEGTWLAGRDGPAAMIMPAAPHVGDVYRTENAPGFVFEEVTVRSVDEVVEGPMGPIGGGLLAEELHSDGSTEDKVFAPGYGEFFTGGGGDVEALALAVPTDARSGPVPMGLRTLSDGALDIFDAAGADAWSRASVTADGVVAAWRRVRSGAVVPRLIGPRMERAIGSLGEGVRARSTARARRAAIDVARLAFDLQLPFRPVVEVDLARLDLWAAQLLLDASAGDSSGVGADAFAVDYVRDRVRGSLPGPELERLDRAIGTIQVAVVDEDLEAALRGARRIRAFVGEVEAIRSAR
jgi:hypothetical protein